MSITSPHHKSASLPEFPKCNQNNNKSSLFAKLGCAACHLLTSELHQLLISTVTSVLSLDKRACRDQWWVTNTCFTEPSAALGRPLWNLEDLFDSQKTLRKLLIVATINEGEWCCSKYLKW